MKIVTIIGARPQFIKAAPFHRVVEKTNDVQEILVHTGQHYDKNMSQIFFDELEIPKPDYHLGIGSGKHGEQTGKMLIAIEEVLLEQKPDVVLIYGDTNSTIAGSLSASKLHIPVAHVEAGLRSNNMMMPEEQNRILTDHISQFLFCPTDNAVRQLKNEGIYDGKQLKTASGKPIMVKNTGDIMYDAFLYNSKLSDEKSSILGKFGLTPKSYALSTIHRAENTDSRERLETLFKALGQLPFTVILALHPRTRKYINQYGIKISDNIRVIDPVGYLDIIQLQKNAKMILTDSGGMQKEAYFLKVPCVTLRDETEWVETVESGWNKVVGADDKKILSAYESFQAGDNDSSEQSKLFGDGHCSEKILDYIRT